jgi:hypothetical protein
MSRPEDKDPDLGKSSPPRSPLSAYEVALALERIKLEMRSNRDEQRREFDLIRADLKTAKDNDERFKVLETHFGVVKGFVVIAVVAGVGALFTVVAKSVSVRIGDAPPPAISSGASTFVDRQSRPDAGTPTPPPLQGR